MLKSLCVLPFILAVSIPTILGAQQLLLKEIIVIPVHPLDANTFEVVENDGAGGTQMWCAAGKFVRGYLGQRGGDIAVLNARAASKSFPGRKSVIFTTLPVQNAVSSVSQGVRTPGQTFSMGHAYALCRSQPEQIIRVRIVGS